MEEEFAKRKNEMLSFLNNGVESTIVDAYKGNPIETDIIDNNLLVDIEEDRDAAFRIIVLVRVHELSNNETIKKKIFDRLKTIPFWITYQENTRVYWTENQMRYVVSKISLPSLCCTSTYHVSPCFIFSMWMTSAQIFYERYPDDADLYVGETLKQRLIHYLQQKLEYGFTEFFSTVYLPYTLGGLLNLADFSQDPDIQSLATKVALKLIDHILTGTNSEGTFSVAAGRNTVGYYLDGVNQMKELIWMLTGLGRKPTKLRSVTAILATSNLDLSSLSSASYDAGFDSSITLPIRPSLGESFEVNKDLTLVDRVMFQWSYGAYFHPDVSAETQLLFDQLDLWDHSEFTDFGSIFETLPTWIGNTGAEIIEPITISSVLTGHDVVIFKNREVVLSSAQNYHPGKLGYQAFPWMATTGTLSVWTQSGAVLDNWGDRPNIPSNTHMPFLKQIDNVLLIMYNAKDLLDLVGRVLPDIPFGIDSKEVALHWPDSLQSVGMYGMWKCGREEPDGGYICVRNDCLGTTTTAAGVLYCAEEYQTWTTIVGNSLMYGSYENFVNKVQKDAVFKSEFRSPPWYCVWCQTDYYGEIRFEGKTISHILHND
jgi:hypothetical protein